ncbi:MAG: hypothetical protein VW058_09325 [Flavobacteriaceae bacterium]
MKKLLFIIVLFLLTNCYKKEGPNCHYSIYLNNNSNSIISTGIKLISGNSIESRTCNIAENIIYPNGIYELPGPLYTCWEDEMKVAGDFEIFVVDPKKTDDNYGFYNCDSIYSYNKILRHYLFTLEEMQARDFMINYPEDEGIEPKE